MSSDEDAWEDFIDEAVSAEKYSRKLSRRIKNTFRAKFERHGDQAGSPGLGFIRTPQPEARLAIDPVAMQLVVQLFEEYAQGSVTYAQLGERHRLKMQHIRSILTNRLYNGWAVRERRSPRETWVAAPWRDDPPVSESCGAASRRSGAGASRQRGASTRDERTCWPRNVVSLRTSRACGDAYQQARPAVPPLPARPTLRPLAGRYSSRGTLR